MIAQSPERGFVFNVLDKLKAKVHNSMHKKTKNCMYLYNKLIDQLI